MTSWRHHVLLAVVAILMHENAGVVGVCSLKLIVVRWALPRHLHLRLHHIPLICNRIKWKIRFVLGVVCWFGVFKSRFEKALGCQNILINNILISLPFLILRHIHHFFKDFLETGVGVLDKVLGCGSRLLPLQLRIYKKLSTRTFPIILQIAGTPFCYEFFNFVFKLVGSRERLSRLLYKFVVCSWHYYRKIFI